VNVQRNLTIEVNLSGANLSGANLSGTRLVANLIETDFCQEEFDNLFRGYGIYIIEHYDANRCREQPDSVVQDFWDILSQA